MLRPWSRALAMLAGASILLAACGGSTPAASTSGGPTKAPAASVDGGATPVPAASTDAGAGDASAMFGGDVCSALTGDEVAAATYPQGKATFSGTDTQTSEDTGKAVVCQYLVTFGDNPATVAAAVSLMSPVEFGNRAEMSMAGDAQAVPGLGTEAWLVYPVPGLTEVWVNTAHGAFKVASPAKDVVVPFARLAAPRA
jgi:hypothetical protein